MRPVLVAAALIATVALTGCGPKMIPGSEIRDTQENREIIDVVAAYRSALEGRNVDGIMKLVSPSFFENSGTPDGTDDYDYAGLKQRLGEWAQKTSAVRADIQLKNIRIEGDKARAQYFYDLNYQVPGPNDVPLWKRESDTNEMEFRREDGAWRITSGV